MLGGAYPFEGRGFLVEEVSGSDSEAGFSAARFRFD